MGWRRRARLAGRFAPPQYATRRAVTTAGAPSRHSLPNAHDIAHRWFRARAPRRESLGVHFCGGRRGSGDRNSRHSRRRSAGRTRARARCRNSWIRAVADCRTAARACRARSGGAQRDGHHRARRQRAVVRASHDLPRSVGQKELESCLSRLAGRLGVRAHRARDHHAGDRPVRLSHRHAFGRRQRGFASVLLLEPARRSTTRWTRARATWRLRSGWITS